MGRFKKKVKLSGPKGEEEIDLWVDTGADHSIIDRKIAENIGSIVIRPIGLTDIHKKVEQAELRAITIQLNGCTSDFLTVTREGVDNVLGADVLQGLDAIVDMKKKDIIIQKCEPYRI
ncbi:MAG: hypothetical protein ABIC57_03635 [bacterium]